MLIALLCFLLVVALQSCAGGALTVGNGLTGAVGGTSYLAEDGDIDEAELRYTEWETDLMLEAGNAEMAYPGYDEYRYNLAAVGHDPYAMLAYLTATHDDFTFAAVQGELRGIFDGQYSLTFTTIVEVRSYTVSWTDSEGNGHSETIYYTYYILQTTLTTRPFWEVIAPLLTTQDERDRYDVYMFLHGNRQYVGSPFDFNWLPYVSSYYGYRVHPISGEKDFHEGVDIALPVGTEIKAGGEGVIVEAGNGGSYGLTLLVDYGDGITARYAHCSALLAGVGQTVDTGDVIALVGNTGNSTGPHLHMEVIKNGRRLNPLYFVDGTVG
jgi:murein DD-endopeptidase MepM/ murein hydrolase activator NlpD